MKPCDCRFAETGRCELAFDQMWRDRNWKLIRAVYQSGWYAFQSEELRRLAAKAEWMSRLQIVSVSDVECEKEG